MKRLLLVISCSIAWNCHIPRVSAAPASSGSSANSNAPKTPALQALYRKAMEAYEAKKFGEARELFEQILSKQSDHTPSRIYLARSLYQQKNSSEALKVFRQIDPKNLEPDAAYEFGQVAFRGNDFTAAIKALAIVPNGHPLYDLAGFYGGISAFKLGEYQQAIDLLDQAVVLPTKLVRMQKLYRKEAEKKLLIKQKQELQGSTSGSKPADRTASVPPAPPGSGFYLIPNRAVGISYNYLNQTLESKDAPFQDAPVTTTVLALDWASEPPAAGAHNQWFLLASFKGLSNTNGSKEFPALQTPDQLLQSMVLLLTEAKTLLRTELGAAYETIIGDRSSFGFQSGVYTYAPDSDFAKRLMGSPYVSVFLVQNGDSIETRFKAEAHARYLASRLIVTQSMQEGIINFNLSKEAYFGLTGELDEYSYNVERLSGPDWNGHILLQLGYRQEKTLSLLLGTFYEIAQGWRIYDSSPKLPLMKFNISQSGILAKADMFLTSWLTLGISGRLITNTYANAIPVGAEELIHTTLPTSISQFNIYTSLTKSF